jgi:hypothetical protein
MNQDPQDVLRALGAKSSAGPDDPEPTIREAETRCGDDGRTVRVASATNASRATTRDRY